MYACDCMTVDLLARKLTFKIHANGPIGKKSKATWTKLVVL